MAFLDLAVTDYEGEVSILLGNGDGTFQPSTVYPEGNGAPSWIATGDFNHDGIPDIAVVNTGSYRSLTVLLSPGF